MENIIRRWLTRQAPPRPIRDPLDHPDIRRMSAHELDDLPWPRPAEKNDILQIAAPCK